MKHVCLFFISAALLLISAAHAQNPQQPYIEVVGTARQEWMPDEFYVSVVLRERYDGREKISIQQQEDKLRKSLTDAGIPDSQFYLSDMSASYIKIRWSTRDVISQKQYTLLVHDTRQLSLAFEAMDRLDIKEANLARVHHSQTDSLLKAVRIEAIQAARDKATYLLQAIGFNPGMPLMVRELEATQAYQTNVYLEDMRVIDALQKDDNPKLPEIQFQKIIIQQAVLVQFSILNP